MRKTLVGLSFLGLSLVFGLFFLGKTAEREAAVANVAMPTEESRSRLEITLSRPINEPVVIAPLKHGIRNAVARGVPVNTIVLLLLFPLTAALVAFSRQVVGLNGFGIFIPALVSVAFLSTGILAGLVIFLAIILAAMSARHALSRIRLPYLPRMAVLIWVVVLAVLGLLIASPALSIERLVGLGIYPILLFIMLAESNIEAQITRTWQAAALMTAETIMIAIVAALLMGMSVVQEWVLANPEITVLLILGADFLIGNYKGLRFLEVWRFRKLIKA